MSKENLDLHNIKKELNKRYKNAYIQDIIDNNDGSVSIVLSGSVENIDKALGKLNQPSFSELPPVDSSDVSKLKILRESATVVRRDSMGPDYMDLSVKPGVLEAKPQDLYKRSMDYYFTQDVYGSSIDLLTNFASKGFKNDIDDIDIRNFYDNWVIDTEFDKIVDQIFFEFFRSGFVRTYKAVGKYIPKINYISTIPGGKTKKVSAARAAQFMEELDAKRKEKAAKKYKWSKDYIPIKYTILNPTLIEIEKSSLLMDQQFVSLKSEALKGVKDLLETPDSELTEQQSTLLKTLSPEMKAAAIAGKDFLLDPFLIGAVDYRKQPYELYPKPRGSRAFESMEYKKALRDADYSTLDGISNYILLITIGNDTFPVKSQDRLEAVSDLFNTPAKAFNVVWDHTLKISRVEPSSVGDILGQEKYRQVNDDITGSFGVVRALIDGVGNPSKAAADLAVKAIIEEIHYARKEVSRWIYKEYRDVAEAMAFDRYPKIRFDNMVLKDEILMMNVIQGMLDRRIISYRVGHEMLGFDPDTILADMEREREKVLDGTLGIIGSPYNPKALPPTQKTPEGTPSEGRPKGKPAKTPAPATKPSKPKPAKEKVLEASFGELADSLSTEDLSDITQFLRYKLMSRLTDKG